MFFFLDGGNGEYTVKKDGLALITMMFESCRVIRLYSGHVKTRWGKSNQNIAEHNWPKIRPFFNQMLAVIMMVSVENVYLNKTEIYFHLYKVICINSMFSLCVYYYDLFALI